MLSCRPGRCIGGGHPESDPLAVDGQITIGNVTLAEPYELTLHAAFLDMELHFQ
jgi:hypothetical protein